MATGDRVTEGQIDALAKKLDARLGARAMAQSVTVADLKAISDAVPAAGGVGSVQTKAADGTLTPASIQIVSDPALADAGAVAVVVAP